MVKIVADDAIPFLKGVLEPYAEVVYKKGSLIGPEDVKDADALVTRTRTRCDAALLEGSSVKIIATATIGMDHIDKKWCDEHGIVYNNAPGCNAGGVMEYVFSALYGTAARKAINLEGNTIGIIGAGNVGKKVEAMARSLGFKVLLNDPPRAAAEGNFWFVSLDEILQKSDIVTMHVPLDESTRRMCNADFFRRMKPGAFFINASRGEVVDEQALMDNIPHLGPVIIDTWNNEPNINRKLMDMVDIATPHIAGYSYQGKQNGASAAVRTIAHFFGWSELYMYFPKTEMENESVRLNLHGLTQGEIASVLQYNYPIFTDDFMFRLDPDGFERLRADYRYRREVFVE